MISVNEKECDYVGVDPEEVERIAKGIAKYAKQARKLNLMIFGEGTGGAGSASLRFNDDDRLEKGSVIVAHISEGTWDGGDGGCREDDEGLLRGEI